MLCFGCYWAHVVVVGETGTGRRGGLLMFFKDSEGEGSIGVAAKPGNDQY